MAKKVSFAQAVIGEDKLNKIGTYEESTGGGTPIPKGEKLKDHPEAKRVQQPRDENGQFTYNSANAKPLKFGPSRGETTPPFLRGVEMVYAVKAKTAIVYKGTVYIAGRDITAEEFQKIFKEYKSDKGFGDIMDDVSAKKGRRSKLEKLLLGKGKEGTVAKEGEKTVRLGYDSFIRMTSESSVKKEKEMVKTTTLFSKSSEEKKDEKPKETVAPPKKDSGEFDSSLAKSDPEAFLDKYGDDIEAILEMPSIKELGVTVGQLLSVIADGGIKSLAHAKELAD